HINTYFNSSRMTGTHTCMPVFILPERINVFYSILHAVTIDYTFPFFIVDEKHTYNNQNTEYSNHNFILHLSLPFNLCEKSTSKVNFPSSFLKSISSEFFVSCRNVFERLTKLAFPSSKGRASRILNGVNSKRATPSSCHFICASTLCRVLDHP